MPAAQTTKLRPRRPGAASRVHPRGHAGTQAQGPAPPRPGPSTGGDHGAKEHRQLTNVARLPSADKDTRQCPVGRPHRRTPRRAQGSARLLPRCPLPAWLPPIEGSRPAPWSQRCRGFPPAGLRAAGSGRQCRALGRSVRRLWKAHGGLAPPSTPAVQEPAGLGANGLGPMAVLRF